MATTSIKVNKVTAQEPLGGIFGCPYPAFSGVTQIFIANDWDLSVKKKKKKKRQLYGH